MNNAENLLKIAEAALALSSEGMPWGNETLLNLLLNIEDSLDKGRSLAPGSDEKLLSQINKRMDGIRTEIRSQLDSMGKEKAKKFLNDRGERMKWQFSV